MLSCRDITRHANDYLEKDMTFVTRIKLKMHLLMCIHCRRYVKQLQTTILTLGKLKDPEPEVTSDEQVNRVIDLLKKNKKES